MKREEPSAGVPARDKQAEEDRWQRHGAERGVWTEPMLAALDRGLKGNKWFSLIDKVRSERTLGPAWEKVRSNAGACGVDGITVERFESIPHDRLMSLVRERIADGRVLDLIGGFLKQGVIEETDWPRAKEEGTPQGGVISPLLANLYLDPLDGLMAGEGFEMVRYADDMVVLCRSREEALAALSGLKEWMEGAGLALHPEKTRVVDLEPAGSHIDFLGCRFQRSRRGKLPRLVRPESVRKLRETIKPKTRRTNGKSMEAIVADLNRTLRGWYGYLKHASPGHLGQIDGWVRMRLRSILRKRHRLKGRGRGRDHQRWPNRYFTDLGLFCLLDARMSESAGLRNGANR